MIRQWCDVLLILALTHSGYSCSTSLSILSVYWRSRDSRSTRYNGLPLYKKRTIFAACFACILLVGKEKVKDPHHALGVLITHFLFLLKTGTSWPPPPHPLYFYWWLWPNKPGDLGFPEELAGQRTEKRNPYHRTSLLGNPRHIYNIYN